MLLMIDLDLALSGLVHSFVVCGGTQVFRRARVSQSEVDTSSARWRYVLEWECHLSLGNTCSFRTVECGACQSSTIVSGQGSAGSGNFSSRASLRTLLWIAAAQSFCPSFVGLLAHLFQEVDELIKVVSRCILLSSIQFFASSLRVSHLNCCPISTPDRLSIDATRRPVPLESYGDIPT